MLKQPIIPYKGRRELVNFVHEAMQSPNHEEVTGPASKRKRVVAPLGKMDNNNNRLMILTPMPLHSGGNVVAGAGMFSRGNRKHKREGPCVGTKGFRAPEDLLDVQFMRTVKLRDWCLINTKRPEILELVPDFLFDLLDKYLTVNPRCRITAEKALMHRFFVPCHESLRKQRLLRRATSSEPEKLSLS